MNRKLQHQDRFGRLQVGCDRSGRKTCWWVSLFLPLALYAATAISLQAQNITTLHSFDYTDGDFPPAACMGRPYLAGPTTGARSSRSRPAAL